MHKALVRAGEALAGGPAPEWLLERLAWASRFIAMPRSGPEDWAEEKRALEAIRYLSDWLPFYVILDKAFDIQIPDAVEDVLPHLDEVSWFLKDAWRPVNPWDIDRHVRT